MRFWNSLFGSDAPPRSAGSAQPERVAESPKPILSQNHAATSAFQKGDWIGGCYEVHQLLGGGMGAVYVVYDHEYREVLALKTFQDRPAEQFSEQTALEQAFQREASAWIALDRHPYILRAHWAQELRGRLFIAMDYIAPDERKRNTVRDYLQGVPLPLKQVLGWGIEFCHGMEHALGKGLLCHRDIKPENILIGSDRHVKIADFGLAAALDHDTYAEPGSGRVEEGTPDGGGLTILRVGKGQVGGTPATWRRKWCGARGRTSALK